MLIINIYTIFVTIGMINGQAVVGPNPEPTSKINADLLSLLDSGESPDVIVSFVGSTNEPLLRASQILTDNRGERANMIYQSLVEHSDKSQSGLEQMLSTRSSTGSDINFKKFWISNQMWVSGADLKTVSEIAEDPNVSGIKVEPVMELLDSYFGRSKRGVGPAPRPENGTIQWNIERVQAPQAWEELGGQGEGIVVAVIDSGVNVNHEALKDNFVGEYGWFDAYYGRLEPYDDGGHGTSVAGVTVGNGGIGVAPGAKWAACKGCDGLVRCKVKNLLTCMEFFACPSLADGSNKDCSKIPHIVVNSWGGESVFDEESAAIDVWLSLGIVPVFAIGNKDQCASTLFPGNHPGVIGVGSINIDNTNDYISSSKGPTDDDRIKPDIVAPGEEILMPNGYRMDEYYIESGTSFACPHVAGVVALILSIDEKLSYKTLKELLFNNTEQSILQVLTEEDFLGDIMTCGSVEDGKLVFPNNVYGYGLVNALGSVKAYKEL